MTASRRPPAAAGPVRRTGRTWPSWVGWAAVVWSVIYGVLGVLWSLGVPGFPFGEGDLPGARDESILGTARAASTAPVIAALCFAAAVVAVLLTRAPRPRAARAALVVLGSGVAATLLLVIPDARPLAALAYAPFALVAAPFGLLPVSYFDKALPWPVMNLLICQLGGLLWAGATVAYRRRTQGACGNCGRGAHRPAGWKSAASAARWGRPAAWVAFALPLFYAVVRWAWVFRLRLGISPSELRELHETGMVWAGAYLASFAALGGVLALGLSYRWGERWPRWVIGLAGRRVPPALPLGAATTVTVALIALGGMTIRTTDWTNVTGWLGNPLFYLPGWGVALGVATLAYRLRTRGRCRVCGRDDDAARPATPRRGVRGARVTH